jgi:hypothetical protein
MNQISAGTKREREAQKEKRKSATAIAGKPKNGRLGSETLLWGRGFRFQTIFFNTNPHTKKKKKKIQWLGSGGIGIPLLFVWNTDELAHSLTRSELEWERS